MRSVHVPMKDKVLFPPFTISCKVLQKCKLLFFLTEVCFNCHNKQTVVLQIPVIFTVFPFPWVKKVTE